MDKTETKEMEGEPISRRLRMSNDKTAEEIEREMLNDVSLKADFYGMEYAPFMFSVFKKFSLYKEQETTASDKTVYTDNSAQQLKEYKEKLKEATELNKEAIALLDVIRMDMVDAGGNAWVVPQIEAIIKKLYPDYFDQTDSTK